LPDLKNFAAASNRGLDAVDGNPKSNVPGRKAGDGGAKPSASAIRILYPCCSKEDVAMSTNFDFSPLFRSTIGFDWLLNALQSESALAAAGSSPSFDIAKTGNDSYRISVAVPGFSQDELSITQEQNTLLVSGKKAEQDAQYLHRGIGGSTFQSRFQLADHVLVTGAGLANGVLTIELKREVPEEMKPRRVAIASGQATAPREPKQIEADKKAA
jgi:molecular chaperone IbpA